MNGLVRSVVAIDPIVIIATNSELVALYVPQEVPGASFSPDFPVAEVITAGPYLPPMRNNALVQLNARQVQKELLSVTLMTQQHYGGNIHFVTFKARFTTPDDQQPFTIKILTTSLVFIISPCSFDHQVFASMSADSGGMVIINRLMSLVLPRHQRLPPWFLCQQNSDTTTWSSVALDKEDAFTGDRQNTATVITPEFVFDSDAGLLITSQPGGLSCVSYLV